MEIFDRLMEEIPHLRRYARLITRDTAHADTLVEACLNKGAVNIDARQTGTNLRARLFAILRTVSRNGYELPSQSIRASSALCAPQNPGLVATGITEAFDALSFSDQEVLFLVVVEDFSYEETALVLGVTTEALRRKLWTARWSLKSLWEEARRKTS